MATEILSIKKHGLYYRVAGAVNGRKVPDTIEFDVPTWEALGHEAAIAKAKRQLEGLQRWFDNGGADADR